MKFLDCWTCFVAIIQARRSGAPPIHGIGRWSLPAMAYHRPKACKAARRGRIRRIMGRRPIDHETFSPLMRDVAKLADVATSTVSRALANPGRVNEKTRCRIIAAVEQLGYVPNAAARNLRVGTSDIVMAVLSQPAVANDASQIIPEVLQSVASTLADSGFNLVIASRGRSAATEKHIPDLAIGGIVRGAIVLGSTELPSYGRRSLAGAGIPIVSLLEDRSAAGIPSVVANDREAMREAVLHLIGLGHRSFFYIAGPAGNYHEIERFAGLAEAVSATGLSDRAIIRHEGARSFQNGFQTGIEAARVYLALKRRPTAAVSCWDDAAIAFMGTVRSQRVAVPGGLSVIGFDGAPVGAFCQPPLTTLQQPTASLGAKAAEILLALLDRDAAEPPVKTVLPCRHLLRASTAAPKGGARKASKRP
ncbi:LacI family repressor for deo operon, udp, cdd, tsx, nupC, and nupG [Inquilinus ginsengisoli]|uniref:LacI family repressor for deo operon, udp, cdd, tsx, nupC, and nupG n=1 Tax=Inquilinus ginsengisoli TaxID=363840 RepID=A0ABU1JP05_9PROT|nr:LacI family DNA-binding transcriptional regulator [Inquilinus ginsengisoli]MDR6290351.1 LacI family repressor for deo operon, udp, cdd, tsx, nupC, and nupG [Inquilinus ginsengisoli]